MRTNHLPDPAGNTLLHEVKPLSIGKRVALAAAGTIGVGAALGLTVFGHTGSVLPTPAAAIVAPGASTHAGPVFGIASANDSGPSPTDFVTVPASAPGPSTIAVSWCPTSPPTNPPKSPGTHPPIRPAALDMCGSDGSVSGPDGGGTGDTGENPGPIGTGNDPGDPNTPPSEGGGGGNCIGDEIECHQPV